MSVASNFAGNSDSKSDRNSGCNSASGHSSNPAFRPCILIPVYNHGPLIGHTLESLMPLALPILLIDDGSDPATRDALSSLRDAHHAITLLQLPYNQGKGAAVVYGIQRARELGFSHAVQIDADGQHASEDIPALLEMAEKTPNALISGAPQYDDSVPRARLYGRYVTHFWVWVETLDLSIIDSMCGFRVYPVAECCELFRSTKIMPRMDFDTDIMVKLYWQGVPVQFYPTRVTYPEQGISHFRMLKDNLRITATHTRLVCGMLWRLPKLLRRKLSKPASDVSNNATQSINQHQAGQSRASHWSDISERGAWLGMSICITLYRWFGQRFLYLLLYPIIGYFFLTNAAARQASASFLQRVYSFGKDRETNTTAAEFYKHPPNWRSSFRHFMAFGESIVDRIGGWSRDIQRDEIVFDNRQMLIDAARSGRGGFILSSHLGNAEMCRALVDGASDVKMNVLVSGDNAAKMGRMMERVSDRVNFELIQISTVGPDTAIRLAEKLANGEFIVIAADRTSPRTPEKAIAAQFLGQQAAFPEGAFILAGLLECPVFLLFCIKKERYHIYLEHFADQIDIPRRQRRQLLKEYVQQYAARLEHYCLMAPQQWFNFFDFWQQGVSAPANKHIPSNTTNTCKTL